MNLKKSDEIKTMFDEIAPKYDFMNDIISFKMHKFIKKIAVNKLKFPYNANVLDLCTGTGDIAKILSTKKRIENIYAVDFSEKMLEIAKNKNSNPKIKYVKSDCTNLFFEDNYFDIITMFFGLRNIEDKESAIKEIYRVLKPGGQFLHLDFKKGNNFLDSAFDSFTPIAGKIFAQNAEAYEYLVKSKQEFLSPKELEKIVQNSNFNQIASYNFLFSTINAQIFVKIN